jgi:hypothetical protein
MQEKITLYFSLSVVLKYKVPVYCYCKKFGKIKKMLDEDQVTALNLAKNGHNLLITGQAGEEDFCVFRNGLISISD